MNELHRNARITVLQSRKKEVWQCICQLTFLENWQRDPETVMKVQLLAEELSSLCVEIKKSEIKKLPSLSEGNLDIEHCLDLRTQGYQDREINKIFGVTQGRLRNWKKKMGLTKSEVARFIEIIESKGIK